MKQAKAGAEKDGEKAKGGTDRVHAIIVMHLDILPDFVQRGYEERATGRPPANRVYQLLYQKHKRNQRMKLRVPLSR